jgi:hypothetical protein
MISHRSRSLIAHVLWKRTDSTWSFPTAVAATIDLLSWTFQTFVSDFLTVTVNQKHRNFQFESLKTLISIWHMWFWWNEITCPPIPEASVAPKKTIRCCSQEDSANAVTSRRICTECCQSPTLLPWKTMIMCLLVSPLVSSPLVWLALPHCYQNFRNRTSD